MFTNSNSYENQETDRKDQKSEVVKLFTFFFDATVPNNNLDINPKVGSNDVFSDGYKDVAFLNVD